MEEILERVRCVKDYTGLTSDARFAERIDETQQNYSRIMSGSVKLPLRTIQNILTTFPEISAEWLLRGIGCMTKGGCKPTESRLRELVPVVPKSLVRAPFTDVYDNISTNNTIEKQEMLPVFPKYDMVSEVYSNAMAPYVQQGSMVVLKKIRPENVMNGDMCVVDLKNIGMVLRFVDVTEINGKPYYILRAAQKERYTPMQVKIEDTYSIFAVVGQFTIYNR